MDLNDLLGGHGHDKRPDHPDFWRMAEIALQMKAEVNENKNNPHEQHRLWQARVDSIVDNDSMGYHATQIAISLMNLETGADLQAAMRSARGREKFIYIVQAFYDGFLMGAEFQQRGGHQSTAQPKETT